MGDDVLMKYLYFLLTFFITTQLFCNELAWVDTQIKAIKAKRVGISDKEISTLTNPFIFFHKNDSSKPLKNKNKIASTPLPKHKTRTQQQKFHFNLEAIINNSAFINNKWYEQGSYIHQYRLVKVGKKSVLLILKNKKLLLYTVSKNKKIKINTQ